MSDMRTKRTRGFTLTEFVLVNTILALLLALLFPVFVRAQGARSRSAQNNLEVCQSRLKKIGLAMLQYAQDYDEKFPLLTLPNRKMSWRGALVPYTRDARLFRCPSNPLHNRNASGDSASRVYYIHPQQGYLTPGKKEEIKISYGANPNLMGTGNKSLPLAAVRDLSRLIAVGESMSGQAELLFSLPVSQFRAGKVLFAGHSGRMNCLFADGHVQALKPTATLDLWFNTPPAPARRKAYQLRLQATQQHYR